MSESTLQALAAKGFEEPSPIQAQTIPLLLQGEKDVIGQAQTGTGKTAAFGLPIIETLEGRSSTVQALILAPTRELAIQVSDELNSLKGDKPLYILPIYGGQPIERQIRSLKRGVDVVVGTPGRILDHLKRNTLDLQDLKFFVLDEADEMLNMGFVEDVEAILEEAGPNRRMLFFSATMPGPILKLASKFMPEHEIVRVKKQDMTTQLTDQIYFELRRNDKFEALSRIIDIEPEFYGIVFCRTKNDVDEVTRHLLNRGYEADGLHGDISQAQRERILHRFRNKNIAVLVATDVAARGIDVQDLSHVINYSLPQDPESYVHRIGRTGRAGKEGTAITFVTPSEYRKLAFIQRIAKTEIRKEKVPKVRDIIRAKKNRIITEVKDILSQEDLDLEELKGVARGILEDQDPETALAALLRFAFKDELSKENYNDIDAAAAGRKDRDRGERGDRRDRRDRDRGDRGDRGERGGRRVVKDGDCRLFVALGKKDNMSKKKLVDFIEQESKVPSKFINDAHVVDTFSFITVSYPDAQKILKAFQKQRGHNNKQLVEMAKDNN